MYLQHFGLEQEPFSIAPDPRFLYMSERHREALAHLLYGLRAGGGFVLLTGDIGAGKTTVCRGFLEQLPPDCEIAYIFNPRLTVIELLETVCQEFGVTDVAAGGSVKTYVDALNRHLLATHAAGRSSVLVIDEAQNLNADVLEQLRLLTNLETNERKLLQVILIGQPELRGLIAQPALEQLAQRVIARYHLQPLDAADTLRYVAHRLAVAGLGGAALFTPRALARMHALTGGVPRRINLLCDRALLGAYGDGRREVDRATLEAAAAEVFDRPAHRPQRAWMLATLGFAGLALLGGAGWIGWRATGTAAPDVGVAEGVAEGEAASSAAAAPASAALAAASVPSLAAEPSASAPPAVVAPALLSATALAQRQGWADEAAAWRALGLRWQIDIAADDPCAAVRTLGMACHRQNTTLAVLRELDRPVLLKLQGADGERDARWALLSGLDRDHATLQLADGEAAVGLDTLALRWHGDFATLWRRPPGVRGEHAAVDDEAQAAWLRERLDQLQAADAFAAGTPLRTRIAAFQRAKGLRPDGVAGPMTLMQLNRAAGEPGPRLGSGGA